MIPKMGYNVLEICDSVTLRLSFEVHISYFELT